MKLPVLVLLLLGMPAQAACYIDVGAGSNSQYFGGYPHWDNGGGVGALLGAECDFAFRILNATPSIHYIHLSQWNVGPPWNDRNESTVDHIGIKLRWKIYE